MNFISNRNGIVMPGPDPVDLLDAIGIHEDKKDDSKKVRKVKKTVREIKKTRDSIKRIIMY